MEIRKIYIAVLAFMIGVVQLPGQTHYETLCDELRTVAFEDDFDKEKIDHKLEELTTVMDSVSRDEYGRCNCADTVWVSFLKSNIKPIKITHSSKLTRRSYLRRLPTKLDFKNLELELKFMDLKTLHDSLEFVIDRMMKKDANRHNPKHNWQKFYHTVEAELDFLKNNCFKLKETYFKIFDNTRNSEFLRDRILLSFFDANENIENEILSRMNDYLGHQYFFRMLGILRRSGTEKSIDFLLGLMKDNEFDLNDKKSILQTIYWITDNKKVKRRTRKRFEHYLKETQLDTLTRNDLYLRD